MIFRMPAVFVGHGSPMNAIEDNRWSQSWRPLARQLPRPGLCISAHWETEGVAGRAVADYGRGSPQLVSVGADLPAG